MHDLRRLGPADVAAAGRLLGAAFHDNPVYRANLGHLSDDARAAAVVRIKTAFADAAVRWQEALALWTNDRLAAVSLVCFSGAIKVIHSRRSR